MFFALDIEFFAGREFRLLSVEEEQEARSETADTARIPRVRTFFIERKSEYINNFIGKYERFPKEKQIIILKF